MKSKHEQVRIKAAKVKNLYNFLYINSEKSTGFLQNRAYFQIFLQDLYMFVTSELREVSTEELNTFLDDFNRQIIEMLSGETHSKMGGILAIVALINADVGNTGTRISRFGNYLRNNCLAQANSLDLAVIELATKAIARLTQVNKKSSVAEPVLFWSDLASGF